MLFCKQRRPLPRDCGSLCGAGVSVCRGSSLVADDDLEGDERRHLGARVEHVVAIGATAFVLDRCDRLDIEGLEIQPSNLGDALVFLLRHQDQVRRCVLGDFDRAEDDADLQRARQEVDEDLLVAREYRHELQVLRAHGVHEGEGNRHRRARGLVLVEGGVALLERSCLLGAFRQEDIHGGVEIDFSPRKGDAYLALIEKHGLSG